MFPLETTSLIWSKLLRTLFYISVVLASILVHSFACLAADSPVEEIVADEPGAFLPEDPAPVGRLLFQRGDALTAGLICEPYGYNVFQPNRPRGQSNYIPWPIGKYTTGIVPRFAAGGRDVKWNKGTNPDSGALFPAPGQINLQTFWEVTQRCHDNNWDYQFQNYWGPFAPRWLQQMGVKFVSYDGGPAPAIAPIPWQPEYLKEFAKCISMLAKVESSPGIKFPEDPLCTMIHITGVQQFSPEMHFSAEMKKLPNFEKNLRFAYQEVFKIWKANFPRKRLCLNLFVPSTDSLMRQIGEDAIAIIGKEQVCFQINHWNAKAGLSNDRPYRYLLELSKRGFMVSLEQTQVSTSSTMGGTFEQTLKRVTESKAVTGTIYAGDMARIKAPWPGRDVRTEAQKRFKSENVKRIERLRSVSHLLEPDVIIQPISKDAIAVDRYKRLAEQTLREQEAARKN